MRVRIRAGRTTMKADEYASLRLIFSAHTSNNANFSQVISQRDLAVTAPADSDQDFALTVTATATEAANANQAIRSDSINVTVNAVAPGYIQTAMTDALTDDQRAEYFDRVAGLVDVASAATVEEFRRRLALEARATTGSSVLVP